MHTFRVEERLGLRCYFGGHPQSPPPVPKPPAPSQAAQAIDLYGRPKRPAGFQSTLLSGPGGVQNQTSQKTLLGG